MTEQWRPILGFEGLYEVSNHGRVRAMFVHHHLKPGRILKPIKVSTNRGPTAVRHAVNLSKNGFKKKHPIHILVCTAFHGPRPSPLHHAAHSDGDGLHNADTNLRWTLPAGNYEDMKRHGVQRGAIRVIRGSLPEEAISEIRRRRAVGEKLDLIAADYLITRTQACAITKGRKGGPL